MPSVQSSELDITDKLALLAVYRLTSSSQFVWHTTTPIVHQVHESLIQQCQRRSVSTIPSRDTLTGHVSRSLNKLCALGLLEKSWRRMRPEFGACQTRRRRGYTLSSTGTVLCTTLARPLQESNSLRPVEQQSDNMRFELVDKFTLLALSTLNAYGDRWYDIELVNNEVVRLGTIAHQHCGIDAVQASLNKLVRMRIVKQRYTALEDMELYVLNDISAVAVLTSRLSTEWQTQCCLNNIDTSLERFYGEVVRTCMFIERGSVLRGQFRTRDNSNIGDEDQRQQTRNQSSLNAAYEQKREKALSEL